MIKYFEDSLYQKTKDTQSDILYAQWNYDKKLIPTALQNISSLFPHYSLHDESHSITILNNIVRIIGIENISKFTAIDIWLLLEASYYHDIGMVISGDKLNSTITSDEFIDFFNEIALDKGHTLYETANLFEIKDNKIRYKDNLFDLATYEGIRYILAEFFRKRHGDHSKEIVSNPSKELSLLSPRGIIPKRIFNILGEICCSHTKEFSDILNLPFCEVGIDVEDAHPRFVACLLRLGDLLDLDNNRFSDVMLRTLNRIPIDTINHFAKHLSIESYRADRTMIQISAKCKDYEIASIIQHWFNYLNSEINNQTINWNEIVPKIELGNLPAIGNLRVELIGYEYVDGKNKPKFSVDINKAHELLQGTGLYDSPYQCLREILQNSVDATLIRLWLEYRDIYTFISPSCEEFIKHEEEYPISINIEKLGHDDRYQSWRISIIDKGIGISQDDLKYLMNTGSSPRNKNRKKIIETMPSWMKPSGAFGIGFQSIFMITESVEMETKSFLNEEYQIVELNSPSSSKSGDILVRKEKTTHATKPGTRLSFIYKTDLIPRRITLQYGHENTQKIINHYDPFIDDSFDTQIGEIIDEIIAFANKTYLPIELEISNEKILITSPIQKFKYYDEENFLEFNIFCNDQSREVSAFYKNQPVKSKLFFSFLSFEINILQEKTKEIITLNRNNIKDDYKDILYNQVLKSAFKIITKNFDEIFITEDEKSLGSMFLNYYSNMVSNFNINRYDQWRNWKIKLVDSTQETISMADLFGTVNSIRITYLPYDYSKTRSEYFILENDILKIFVSDYFHSDTTKFFFSEASKLFKYISKISGTKEVVFTKNSVPNAIVLENIIEFLKKQELETFTNRAIIPCIEKYSVLRLKDDAFKGYVKQYNLDDNIKVDFPKMLSPYLRISRDKGSTSGLEVSINEKIIDWVYNNRNDLVVSKEQIKESYKKFIDDTKPFL